MAITRNASEALEIVQMGLELKPGDEVLTTAVGFPTTVSPILQYGCLPVFVDVDPETANVRVDPFSRGRSDQARQPGAETLAAEAADGLSGSTWVAESPDEGLADGRRAAAPAQVGRAR